MRKPDPRADVFLESIDARIAALQQLRASYLAARAAGAFGLPGDPSLAAASLAPLPPPLGAPPDSRAQGVPSPESLPVALASTAPPPAAADAGRPRKRGAIAARIDALLDAAERPVKAGDIAAVLRREFALPAAARIEGTINSTLHRLKHRGRALRTDTGWIRPASAQRQAGSPSPPEPEAPAGEPQAAQGAASLAVPGSAPMPATTTGTSHAPVRRPRKRRPRSPAQPAPDRQQGGLAWRIESLLKSHGQPVAARYVADATGEPLNVVGLALGRMVKQQRVERRDGQFVVVVPETDEAQRDDASGGAAGSS